MFAQELRSRGGMIPARSNPQFDFNQLYPIGTIYMSVDPNFNPNHATGWYGVWVELNDGYYLRTASSDENLGSYYSHTLHFTTDGTALLPTQLPKHVHRLGMDVECSLAGNHQHNITTACANNDTSCHTHNAITRASGRFVGVVEPSYGDYLPFYEKDGTDQTDSFLKTVTKQDSINLGNTAADAEIHAGKHTHDLLSYCNITGEHDHVVNGWTDYNLTAESTHSHTFAFNGDQLKPRYCAIKMWKRTA